MSEVGLTPDRRPLRAVSLLIFLLLSLLEKKKKNGVVILPRHRKPRGTSYYTTNIFNGITFVGYFMPKPFLLKNSSYSIKAIAINIIVYKCFDQKKRPYLLRKGVILHQHKRLKFS